MSTCVLCEIPLLAPDAFVLKGQVWYLQMSGKFAMGWFRLFGIIYTSLNSDTVPTATQVVRGITESATDDPSCIRIYLDQGGK